jgi:hypothetical protein
MRALLVSLPACVGVDVGGTNTRSATLKLTGPFVTIDELEFEEANACSTS